MNAQQFLDVGIENDGTLYIPDPIHFQATQRLGFAPGYHFNIYRTRHDRRISPMWAADNLLPVVQHPHDIIHVRPMREYPYSPYLRLPEGL